MKLAEIILEIEKEALPRLRIKTPSVEFSFGSEEYIRHVADEYEEWKVVEDYPNRCLLLTVYTEKQEGKKEREKPYTPEEPLYPGIGL